MREAADAILGFIADEVQARGYNIDFKNAHTVAYNHGDPEELLAKPNEAKREAAALRYTKFNTKMSQNH